MQNDDRHDSHLHEPPAGDAQRAARCGRAGFGALLVVLTVALVAAARQGPEKELVGSGDPLAALHAAAGGVELAAQLDRGAVLAGGDGIVKLELQLRGVRGEDATIDRAPTDFVVILDRSGSMSGDAIARAKQAVREIASSLRVDDRLALVSYASDARVDVELEAATPAARERWLRRLAMLPAQGGTNMSAGLDLALAGLSERRVPGRVARVLLLSDGHANEGDSSREGLQARARRAIPGEFVLSTVGVGTGFDEGLMSALADAGTGSFYYVRQPGDLAPVLAGELVAARDTVASALAVELELAPGVELLDAAGYPVERGGTLARFRPGDLFGGQDRRLWLTLRVDAREAVPSRSLTGVAVTWRDRNGAPARLALAEPPVVAITEERARYLASVEPEAFERQLQEDGIGALKRQVADALRKGDPDEAKQAIEAFRTENAATLEQLGYDEAGRGRILSGARALRTRVEEAMSPATPAARRSDLTKEIAQESNDDRRQGAKPTSALQQLAPSSAQ